MIYNSYLHWFILSPQLSEQEQNFLFTDYYVDSVHGCLFLKREF